MPYEISFTKPVKVADPDIYINACCYGCDIFRDELLPEIKKLYSDIQTGQEDWGWFIWIRRGPLTLAVDIYCDDPE